MDILYYSNNCKFCQKLLPYLAKNGMTDKFNFICIDRRTRDQFTQQTYVYLERGSKALLPPNVHRVPTLVLINEKYRSVVGDEIYGYLEMLKSAPRKAVAAATGGGGGGQMIMGGEPSGYVLGSSAGGVNIVSETFTYYDASPEELLAKGTGSMRQMHNYAPVTIHEIMKPIFTPEETYRPNKVGGDVTLDSLQQQRNDELQATIPHLAQNINQAIMPEISQVKNPGISSQPSTNYQPLHHQPPPNMENAREILFGKGSGWSGGEMENANPSAQVNSPYLANM